MSDESDCSIMSAYGESLLRALNYSVAFQCVSTPAAMNDILGP